MTSETRPLVTLPLKGRRQKLSVKHKRVRQDAQLIGLRVVLCKTTPTVLSTNVSFRKLQLCSLPIVRDHKKSATRHVLTTTARATLATAKR